MPILTKEELIAQLDQVLVDLVNAQGICSQLYAPLKALTPDTVHACWDLREIEVCIRRAVAFVNFLTGRYLA